MTKSDKRDKDMKKFFKYYVNGLLWIIAGSIIAAMIVLIVLPIIMTARSRDVSYLLFFIPHVLLAPYFIGRAWE